MAREATYKQVPQAEDASEKKPHGLSPARAAAATVLYCLAGPSLIFLNKHILVEVEFPYGSALSLLGVTMSTLLSIVALMLGWFPCDQTRSLTPQTYCTRVLPIGIALGLCLTTGNVAYLYNSVAFIQILKAFAPVVLLLVLFAARLEKPSATLIASIMIISGGTAVAVRGEVELSLIGVAYMLASEFFEAVKLVMTQILLVDRKFGSVEGLAVVGPAAMAALCVCTILGEDWRDAMEKVGERPLLFLAASLGGVVVNLATNMMVAATSALTLRVTSLLRNIGIVFVSTAILRDSTLTVLEGVGFCIALTGFVLYQHARRNPAHSFADIWRDLTTFCGGR